MPKNSLKPRAQVYDELKGKLYELLEHSRSDDQLYEGLIEILVKKSEDVDSPAATALSKLVEMGDKAQAGLHLVHDLKSFIAAVVINLSTIDDLIPEVLGYSGDPKTRHETIAEFRIMLKEAFNAAVACTELSRESMSVLGAPEHARASLLAVTTMAGTMLSKTRRSKCDILGYESVSDYSLVVRPSQLLQVVLNLMRNADEAMEGQADGRVEVKAWATEGFAFVSVADNGPGIPEADAERVFDLFHTTKSYGTGVGLPNCKRLVQNWGGDLTVESSDQGTTFVFSIPRAER